MKKYLLTICLPTLALLFASITPARAMLYDRGGGLLYDDVLNITWMQDANYAKTWGFNTDGIMAEGASNFLSAVNSYGYYDSVRNITYKDWRLPKIESHVEFPPIIPPTQAELTNSAFPPKTQQLWDLGPRDDGLSDVGYNITSPKSELSYMFYVNLGLKGLKAADLSVNGDYGISSNSTLNGNSILNLQNGYYISGSYTIMYGYIWVDGTISSSPCWGLVTESFPLGVDFGLGEQGGGYSGYAWLVRDGDVAAIPTPEPATILLFGAGLAGLTAVSRRKRN